MSFAVDTIKLVLLAKYQRTLILKDTFQSVSYYATFKLLSLRVLTYIQPPPPRTMYLLEPQIQRRSCFQSPVLGNVKSTYGWYWREKAA